MEEHKVKFSDEHHVWVDGKQYISLSRFFANRLEIATEQKTIAEENERLLEENKHLKALLKESL